MPDACPQDSEPSRESPAGACLIPPKPNAGASILPASGERTTPTGKPCRPNAVRRPRACIRATSAMRDEQTMTPNAASGEPEDHAIFLMSPDGIITLWGEGARLIKWWTKDE